MLSLLYRAFANLTSVSAMDKAGMSNFDVEGQLDEYNFNQEYFFLVILNFQKFTAEAKSELLDILVLFFEKTNLTSEEIFGENI